MRLSSGLLSRARVGTAVLRTRTRAVLRHASARRPRTCPALDMSASALARVSPGQGPSAFTWTTAPSPTPARPCSGPGCCRDGRVPSPRPGSRRRCSGPETKALPDLSGGRSRPSSRHSRVLGRWVREALVPRAERWAEHRLAVTAHHLDERLTILQRFVGRRLPEPARRGGHLPEKSLDACGPEEEKQTRFL